MIIPLFDTTSQSSRNEQLQALQNLAFVRETMANAGAFTTIPGWGMIATGFSALIVSLITMNITNPELWIFIWILEAVIAISIGMASICHKNKTLGLTVFQGIGLRFLINLFAPVTAAIPLTYVFWTANLFNSIAGLWLLMFGISIITAGSYSFRLVVTMGICFCLLGILGLTIPAIPNDILMMIGFGCLHVVFGSFVVIYQDQTKWKNHERETEETSS